MAHFAKLTLNGRGINQNQYDVNTIEVVVDSIATTEQAGIDFLNNLHNIQGSNPCYKQSFTNQQIRDNPEGKRKNPAMPGGTYDPDNDVFIPRQLFKSWTLNAITYQWDAPVPYPADASVDKGYRWNEETRSWVHQIPSQD